MGCRRVTGDIGGRKVSLLVEFVVGTVNCVMNNFINQCFKNKIPLKIKKTSFLKLGMWLSDKTHGLHVRDLVSISNIVKHIHSK